MKKETLVVKSIIGGGRMVIKFLKVSSLFWQNWQSCFLRDLEEELVEIVERKKEKNE